MDYYNPDSAAAIVGASPSSIRNWCKAYAPVLSAGANPPVGTERRLTPADIAILQQVKAMRSGGQTVPQIQAVLAQGHSAPLTIDAMPTALPEQPQQQPETSLAMLQLTANALQQIADRVTAQERGAVNQVQREVANLRTMVWVLFAVVVVLIVAVVWLWV